MERLTRDVEDACLLTLTGSARTGKTRLALRVTAELQSDFLGQT